MALTYKESGVDIDAGATLVSRIRPLAKATMRPEVIGGIGGFAALCALPTKYREPILVSGTDGVGTKLKSAIATGRHSTIGQDLVAMCVNDVLVTGAEPLFFLDYFATGALNVDVATEVIRGIAHGCTLAGCALVGGETAELPGLYHTGDYDIAGFCVGVVEKSLIRPRLDLAAGDIVIGLPSAGLHSNGHSLARRIVLEVLGLGFDATPPELAGQSVADALLAPTIIYSKAFANLAGIPWKAAAHITGGGIIENPPRIFSDDELAIELDLATWTEPGIFALIRSAGVSDSEMHRTFNCGLGMIIVVDPSHVDDALAALVGYEPRCVGQLRRRNGDSNCQLIGVSA
jgi:phosphoribosylformylglycinamidine cyclo-ligase